jgi:hypothetical protein
MKKSAAITCLFLDIGGVLLTNGWDHQEQRRAARHFKLEWADMEERHFLNFESHEEGRLALAECFVGLRKPDVEMFRLAVDIAPAPAQQVVYTENAPMFVQIAEDFGIRSIPHADYKSTFAKLASLGLQNYNNEHPHTYS